MKPLKVPNGYTFEMDTGSKPMSSQDFPYFQKSKKILNSHWLTAVSIHLKSVSIWGLTGTSPSKHHVTLLAKVEHIDKKTIQSMSIDILSSCYFGGLKLSFNDRMALMVSTSVYWVPLTAAFTEASDTRIKGFINFSLKNRLYWNYNPHNPQSAFKKTLKSRSKGKELFVSFKLKRSRTNCKRGKKLSKTPFSRMTFKHYLDIVEGTEGLFSARTSFTSSNAFVISLLWGSTWWPNLRFWKLTMQQLRLMGWLH